MSASPKQKERTVERKAEFLRIWAEDPTLTQERIAKQMGLSHTVVFEWSKRDEAFKTAVAELSEERWELLSNLLWDHAFGRSELTGQQIGSIRLLISSYDKRAIRSTQIEGVKGGNKIGLEFTGTESGE